MIAILLTIAQLATASPTPDNIIAVDPVMVTAIANIPGATPTAPARRFTPRCAGSRGCSGRSPMTDSGSSASR